MSTSGPGQRSRNSLHVNQERGGGSRCQGKEEREVTETVKELEKTVGGHPGHLNLIHLAVSIVTSNAYADKMWPSNTSRFYELKQ